MLKPLQKTNKGFTIIEVMIVLAIAGLIILIVLLAVPALQRSGRNTAVKNDASAMAAGISEFESNNNGTVPTGFTGLNGTITLTNVAASIASGGTAKLQGATTINGSTTGPTLFAAAQPVAANVSAGALWVVSKQGCQTTAGVAPTVSSKAFAIYYWTESTGVAPGADTTTGIINGNGLKGQCLES